MRRELPPTAMMMNLTILTWDIAESCTLLRVLGLERYSRVVRACQEAAAETIEAHGGFVARYMGDALLAYFGFPHARPDDSERAVCAAVSLPMAWPAGDVLVRARVAIASGEVIVGAPLGTGSAREFPAFGEAPNLASRLLGAAPAPGVVLDEATGKAVRHRFGLMPLDGLTLKGFPQVRRAWQVRGGDRPPAFAREMLQGVA